MVALPTLASITWVMDLDVDAVTGLVTGDPCGTLPDNIEARHATQATIASQPIYTASDPDFGGHASLEFQKTAADDYMEQTSPRATPINRRTIVWIGKVLSTADDIVWTDGTTAATDTQLYYSSSGAGKTSIFDDGGRIDFGARLTSAQIIVAGQGTTDADFASQNGGTRVAGPTDSTYDPYDMQRVGCDHALARFAPHKLSRVAMASGHISADDQVTLDTWAQDNKYVLEVADYAGTTPVETAPNVLPVANPGASRTEYIGSIVTLAGSGTDEDGEVVGYEWTALTVPTGSTAALSSTTAQAPTFKPDVAGAFTSSLVVIDDVGGQSDPVSITITAEAAPTPLPRFVIGLDGVRRAATRSYFAPKPGTPVLADPATAITATGFTSSWTAADKATDYLVQRKTGVAAFATVATVTTTSYAHTGLTASTTYDVRIIARNGTVEGAASNTVTTTTTA